MASREEEPDGPASTVLWADGDGASRKIDESLEPTARDSKDQGSPATEPDPSLRVSRPDGVDPDLTMSRSTGGPERAGLTPTKTDESTEAEDKTLPRSIGRYRIFSLLGRGGFGLSCSAMTTSWIGWSRSKSPSRTGETPEDVQAFLDEARFVASLDHKGIVPVYDVGRTPDGLCFVVSKFIEGCSLAQRMRHRPFSLDGSSAVDLGSGRCSPLCAYAWDWSIGTSSRPTSS